MKTILLALLSIFRVALVGDPQVDDRKELDFARKSIYRELRERKDLDLVIVLGDIVNEKPALIPDSEASLDSLRCPWVRIHGNHDGKEIANDTTFMAGGIRFVMLNHNVLPDSSYTGKTVICAHEPFKPEELKQDNPDILYALAHLHRVIRKAYPGGSECLIAGATCGTWWRGKRDENGIPYALMGCGAPRGYFIADFDPDKEQWYTLQYKCVDKPASFQARAWKRDGNLTVNVFGGSSEGEVEARIKGRWVRLEHKEMIDPEVQDIIKYNKGLSRAERRRNRESYMPMLSSSSTHIWNMALPDSLSDRTRKIKIRYKDRAMKFKTTAPLLD